MTLTPERTTSESQVREQARAVASSLRYSTGFGNEHASEAADGALPAKNTPQRPPHGLYTELMSGTAFPELRQNTRRSWLYRIRPSIASPHFERTDHPTLLTPPFTGVPVEPHTLVWAPQSPPHAGIDFIDGLWALGGNGGPESRTGVAIHFYTANSSMTDRVFSDIDGELAIVPEQGRLLLRTEFGLLAAGPGEVVVVPRAVKFRVELLDEDESSFARGWVFENFGTPFALPDLGYIGQSGMAEPRDFRAPVAAYDDARGPVEVVQKVGGNLWRATYDESPLDVVAWHGTNTPYVYDMRAFQIVGPTNFGHTDPSRFTMLTSTTATPGSNNIDLCPVPPEWVVSRDSFRPQYFHRNIAPEFLGVVEAPSLDGGGVDDLPQGLTALTNTFTPHGINPAGWEAATNAGSDPVLRDGLILVVETQCPIHLTEQAAAAALPADGAAPVYQTGFRR